MKEYLIKEAANGFILTQKHIHNAAESRSCVWNGNFDDSHVFTTFADLMEALAQRLEVIRPRTLGDAIIEHEGFKGVDDDC